MSFLIATRLAMPVILVAPAVVALVGGTLKVLILVIGLLIWDRFAVVSRASTQQLRHAEYVFAARATGCSTLRILLTEILPNISNNMIVVATLEIARAILLEAALSFLGMGVQPPMPTWGLMIAEGKEFMPFSPWVITIPRERAVRPGARGEPDGRRYPRYLCPGDKLMTALLEVLGLNSDIPLATGTLHPVRDVSFSVNAGETLCLVGESGCRKSLTALAVMGLLPRAARSRAQGILLNGRDLTRLSPRQMADVRGHHMSMIFQDPYASLNPRKSIGEIISLPLRIHKVGTPGPSVGKKLPKSWA